MTDRLDDAMSDERFADWVDGRMSPRDRERFEAEMGVNPDLRRRAEAYRRTVDSVRNALRAGRTGVDLSARVMAAVAAEPPIARGVIGGPWRRAPRRAVMASCAVAAGVLGLLSLLFQWQRGPEVATLVHRSGDGFLASDNPASDKQAEFNQPQADNKAEFKDAQRQAEPGGAPEARFGSPAEGLAEGSAEDRVRDRAEDPAMVRPQMEQGELLRDGGKTQPPAVLPQGLASESTGAGQVARKTADEAPAAQRQLDPGERRRMRELLSRADADASRMSRLPQLRLRRAVAIPGEARQAADQTSADEHEVQALADGAVAELRGLVGEPGAVSSDFAGSSGGILGQVATGGVRVLPLTADPGSIPLSPVGVEGEREVWNGAPDEEGPRYSRQVPRPRQPVRTALPVTGAAPTSDAPEVVGGRRAVGAGSGASAEREAPDARQPTRSADAKATGETLDRAVAGDDASGGGAPAGAWLVEGDADEVADFLARLATVAQGRGYRIDSGEVLAQAVAVVTVADAESDDSLGRTTDKTTDKSSRDGNSVLAAGSGSADAPRAAAPSPTTGLPVTGSPGAAVPGAAGPAGGRFPEQPGAAGGGRGGVAANDRPAGTSDHGEPRRDPAQDRPQDPPKTGTLQFHTGAAPSADPTAVAPAEPLRVRVVIVLEN